MRRFALLMLVAALFAVPVADAFAAYSGSSGGSRSSGGSSSSGSRSSGGSKPSGGGSKVPSSSGGSGSKSSGQSSKPRATPSKPSTGPKQQPAPATRLVPATPPANLRNLSPQYTRGHDYGRDRTIILREPYRLDPYSSSYYGTPGNPYFYLYLLALTDDDHGNDPVSPQYRERDDDGGGMSPWHLLWIVPVSVGVGAVGGYMGGSSSGSSRRY